MWCSRFPLDSFVQQLFQFRYGFLAQIAALEVDVGELRAAFGQRQDLRVTQPVAADVNFGELWAALGQRHQRGVSQLLAAIERILPHFKGDLLLAHAELNAWSVAFVKHTAPMLWLWCILVARRFLVWDLHRVAGLLLLQRRRGLRPGEALGLRAFDLVMPSAHLGSTSFGALLLGARAGT